MIADPLEKLWDEILSCNKILVDKAFADLSEQQKQAVRSHLGRMTTEPDWHPEQVRPAKFAIKVLHTSK